MPGAAADAGADSPPGTGVSDGSIPTGPSPLLPLLDQFTAPDVPAQGPMEPPPIAHTWVAPTAPPMVPGSGLAAHPMLFAGEGFNTVLLVNQGKVVWSYTAGPPGTGEIDDVWMLSNAHVLVAFQHSVFEVNPKKEIVWHYVPPTGTEVHSCQPIGLDRVLLVQNAMPAQLMIINKNTGMVEVQHALPIQTSVHTQFRRIRMTAKSTYILPILNMGVVWEYDATFKQIWSYQMNTPWAAVRLHNGNTLITDEMDRTIREVTPQGTTAWEYKQAIDLPKGLLQANTQTADRLSNGDTVIFSSQSNTSPTSPIIQALEIDSAKKPVWVLQDWKDLGPATTAQFLDEPGIPERPGDLQH
jgi:hypothetical protein